MSKYALILLLTLAVCASSASAQQTDSTAHGHLRDHRGFSIFLAVMQEAEGMTPHSFHYFPDDTVWLGKELLHSDHSGIAEAYIEDRGDYFDVRVVLDQPLADKFARITGEHTHKTIAFVVDGNALTAPMIVSRIDGGRFSLAQLPEEEARDLVAILNQEK